MNPIRRRWLDAPTASARRFAVAVLLLVGLLQGCGFQPRGQSMAVGELPARVLVLGLASYDPLYRSLAGELSRAGSTLVTDAAETDAVLLLSGYAAEQRILTLDSSAKVIEYELEEAVRFRLNDPDGRTRVQEQRVRVLRILYAPPSGVLGYGHEIDAVRADMRRDLARRILQRIAAQN
jgi:outer membrane lipopolysaccharide assembly protein LptE/RlpB